MASDPKMALLCCFSLFENIGWLNFYNLLLNEIDYNTTMNLLLQYRSNTLVCEVPSQNTIIKTIGNLIQTIENNWEAVTRLDYF